MAKRECGLGNAAMTLHCIRVVMDVSIAEFADQLGFSRCHVSSMEHGHAEPTMPYLNQVSRVSGIPVERIVEMCRLQKTTDFKETLSQVLKYMITVEEPS